MGELKTGSFPKKNGMWKNAFWYK